MEAQETHRVFQIQFLTQGFQLFFQLAGAHDGHLQVWLAFLQSGAQPQKPLGVLLIGQPPHINQVIVIGIGILRKLGVDFIGVNHIIQDAALIGKQLVKGVTVKGALGHPENVLCPETRQQIANGFRRQSPGIVGVVVNVGNQGDFPAAQGGKEAGSHVVGVDEVWLLLPDDPAELRNGHGLHRKIRYPLPFHHFPDDIAFRAAIDHLHFALKGMDDLADHLLRAGIDPGVQNVHHFHKCPSFSSTRAPSPMLRLRIP